MKVKVKNNAPYYSPIIGCYIVDYTVDGQKRGKVVGTYQEGIEWLKTTFPDWFKKHYTQTT